MYTVHAEYHNHSFPLLYGLLPDKQQVTYERFLRLIIEAVGEHNVNFRPEEVKVDFEMAAIQAVHTTLPGTTVKGCLFHYGQCINWAVQRIGLAGAYRDPQQEDLRRWIQRIAGLPVVPLGQLDFVWAEVTLHAPNIPQAAEMHRYVNTT